MKNVSIGIATHKKYKMPKDEIYLPIHSGAIASEIELGYQKDSESENISKKNPNYSELTALYWLWKNNDSEYKGLVHYRRHFSSEKHFFEFRQGNFKEILHAEKLNILLDKSDIILPKKRNYVIETIKSHYEHTHNTMDLVVTEEVIHDFYPEYLNSYHSILHRRSAHMFNMFIMSKEKFDEYCEWLFSILFKVEERLDISEYNEFHSRVFGRISEILLDVWLEKKEYNFIEIPVMFMEKQSWFFKIKKFTEAKFYGKSY